MAPSPLHTIFADPPRHIIHAFGDDALHQGVQILRIRCCSENRNRCEFAGRGCSPATSENGDASGSGDPLPAGKVRAS